MNYWDDAPCVCLYMHMCMLVYVCLFTALSERMGVYVCFFPVNGGSLVAPAAVLLHTSIGWIIKGPRAQPIGSAVITVPRWYGPMG